MRRRTVVSRRQVLEMRHGSLAQLKHHAKFWFVLPPCFVSARKKCRFSMCARARASNCNSLQTHVAPPFHSKMRSRGSIMSVCLSAVKAARFVAPMSEVTRLVLKPVMFCGWSNHPLWQIFMWHKKTLMTYRHATIVATVAWRALTCVWRDTPTSVQAILIANWCSAIFASKIFRANAYVWASAITFESNKNGERGGLNCNKITVGNIYSCRKS